MMKARHICLTFLLYFTAFARRNVYVQWMNLARKNTEIKGAVNKQPKKTEDSRSGILR